MTRLGYQIPNFTYPGVGPDRLFAAVVAQAQAAERSGFDTILLMDHFYQLPMLGQPDDFMLECYTTLAALSQQTQTVRLGALVTGNTYRNPTLLAKAITALDVVSGGRAQLGIGSGWFELEHDALGYEFNSFTERFAKLEESLQIILPMLRGERPSLAGTHYTVSDAINQPPPIGKIPVMIGGSGERKTLRLVAQYADESNLICGVDEVARKLDVLAGHCADVGRDRAEITVSLLQTTCIAPTADEARAELGAYLTRRGIDFDSLSADEQDAFLGMVVWGGPDEVAEKTAAALATGVDGITVNLPANGHNPERVELLGETIAPLLSPAPTPA